MAGTHLLYAGYFKRITAGWDSFVVKMNGVFVKTPNVRKVVHSAFFVILSLDKKVLL